MQHTFLAEAPESLAAHAFSTVHHFLTLWALLKGWGKLSEPPANAFNSAMRSKLIPAALEMAAGQMWLACGYNLNDTRWLYGWCSTVVRACRLTFKKIPQRQCQKGSKRRTVLPVKNWTFFGPCAPRDVHDEVEEAEVLPFWEYNGIEASKGGDWTPEN